VKAGESNVKGPLTAALDVTSKLAEILGQNKKTFQLAIAPIDRKSGRTTAAATPVQADRATLVQ
jgi:hypothetical protein